MGILIERFWSKVDKTAEGGCWLWTAAKNDRGYGVINMGGKLKYAHRLSLTYFVGEAPQGKPNAIHSCRNKHCVNPSHLRWGSQKENAKDRVRDGTMLYGTSHGSCKLTNNQVMLIYNDSRIQKEIAVSFGLCRQQVSHIKLGKRWSHLTGHGLL